MMQDIKYLTNRLYSEFIDIARYAKWLPEKKRRETWKETVRRYVNFWSSYLTTEELEQLFNALYYMYITPSMRCLMTAGKALERDNVAGFNCSYLATGEGGESYAYSPVEPHFFLPPIIPYFLENIKGFDETMYILMCGAGVGYSVERQYINKLPVVGSYLNKQISDPNIPENYPNVDRQELSTFYPNSNLIEVADSKYGWSSAFRMLLTELYSGNFNVKWDVSKVRPKGSPLLTFGGRASGSEPLVNLFKFTVNLFKEANGRKLNSIEVHSMMCMIGDIVVVGGVRRAALICLSNLSDDRMRHAKTGQWWIKKSFFSLANISVAYTEKPDADLFLKEWLTLVESKSGERGIFNRIAAQTQSARWGKRIADADYGLNPCAEIILLLFQLCNLSEVIIRPDDGLDSLMEKVKWATICGTLQATLTNFKYLSPIWKENTEKEALLGVSLTGIMDHPLMRKPSVALKFILNTLRDYAVEVNAEYAKRFGINPASAITCIKPSGTVSQLTDTSSGIHSRWSPFYLRRVKGDLKDPLTTFMKAKGFPYEPKIDDSENTGYFIFPIKSPKGSVFRNDRSAIEQLELALFYQQHWCHHNVSCTIYVKTDEWVETGAWVYKHFDELIGVSFLPSSGEDTVYVQTPYQDITEEEYNEWIKKMPTDVDWTELANYEKIDTTTGSQELACVAGGCDF